MHTPSIQTPSTQQQPPQQSSLTATTPFIQQHPNLTPFTPQDAAEAHAPQLPHHTPAYVAHAQTPMTAHMRPEMATTPVGATAGKPFDVGLLTPQPEDAAASAASHTRPVVPVLVFPGQPPQGVAHSFPPATGVLNGDAAGAGMGMDAAAGAPPNWEQRMDAKSGRIYYLNHTTHTTSWVPPPNAELGSVAPAPAAPAPAKRFSMFGRRK